jgi:dihydrofolate reductase
MGKVMSALTMSLDGFIAGPNDGPERPLGEGGERLFDWYFKGDHELKAPLGSGEMTFKVSPASAAVVRERLRAAGAVVSGRRTFDIANGWGSRHPADVPIFVVTHTLPEGWANDGAPFTFVTEGVERAVELARAVAGDKSVGVGAASVAQQCLRAGLLDELEIDLVPILLGGGVRLFDRLGAAPYQLATTSVVAAPGVTHLRYRVVRES